MAKQRQEASKEDETLILLRTVYRAARATDGKSEKQYFSVF
jgi:hypothetical protein